MIIRKYYEIWKINLISNLAYFWDYFVYSLLVGFVIFVLVNLWKIVYSKNALIEGFTLPMMIWYLVMAESLVSNSNNGHLIKEINQEIKSGDMAYLLNKPYNYIGYHYAKTFSQCILDSLTTFMLAGIIAFMLIGKIEFSILSIPFLLVVILGSFTIDFLISTIIGICAFWLEDTSSFRFIYEKFIYIIGGMLMPLELFPKWLGVIAEKLPFSYIAYYPSKLFVMFSFDLFFKVVLGQIIYILGIGIVLIILYKLALRGVNINGG